MKKKYITWEGIVSFTFCCGFVIVFAGDTFGIHEYFGWFLVVPAGLELRSIYNKRTEKRHKMVKDDYANLDENELQLINEVNDLVGRRVRVIKMNDPDPVPTGTEGKIYHIGGGVVNVEWDNGRNIGLIIGVDQFEFI